MMFSGDERSLLHHASDELTLDEVLGRLEASERVLGVLRIGSQGEPSPDSCSDLDLVIVLRGVDALPYRVGLTWIAGQLCDLLYVSEGQIDALLSNDDILDAGVWLGRIARWFAAGAVLLDSDGRLTQLSEALRSSERIAAPDPTQQGDLVWSIGYNLEQNKRMAHSEDALYRTALEMRLLYCVSDLMTAYFSLRGLFWQGEKAALRHWRECDAAYGEAFAAYFAASNLNARWALYLELVSLTLAPVGGPWGRHRVPAQPLAEAGLQDIWEDLVAGR